MNHHHSVICIAISGKLTICFITKNSFYNMPVNLVGMKLTVWERSFVWIELNNIERHLIN